MGEAKVHDFLNQQNRPFNAQGVADHVAQYGIKKGQVQKYLDSLAEAGKITCKEFGKTKVYLAKQDNLPVPNKEEMEEKTRRKAELTRQVQEQSEVMSKLKKELQSLQSSMTVEQMQERIKALEAERAAKEAKLAPLRSGAVLVSAEDRKAVEKKLSENLNHWAKRKRIFRSIWDEISEGMEQKPKVLFEELGIETDEDRGLSLHEFQALVGPAKLRRY